MPRNKRVPPANARRNAQQQNKQTTIRPLSHRRFRWLGVITILALVTIHSDCLALSSAVLVPRTAPPTGPLPPGVVIDSRWSLLCETVPQAVVHWTCTPFAHESESKANIDAKLNLIVEGSQGLIGCRVFRQTDRTDFANGQRQATVAAHASGTGITNFQVVVSMIGHEEDLAEGGYATNLVGTVTSN